MADPHLLTAKDYVAPYDHGQFWLYSCLCPEEDYALDEPPVPDYDALGELNYRELRRDEGIWQSPAESSSSSTLVVLSPHQTNLERPLRLEIWNGPPPDDTADWPEAFEAHLDVDPHGLYYTSPMMAAVKLHVPPGAYHALITGRGFIARGNPGVPHPGDSWRIRLWASPGSQAPRRLSAWRAPGQ